MDFDDSLDPKSILHHVGDMMSDGFVMLDESGRVKYANEEFLLLIGESDNTPEGELVYSYLDAENQIILRDLIDSLSEDTKVSTESVWGTNIDEQIPTLVVGNSISRDSQDRLICLVVADTPQISNISNDSSSEQSFEDLLEMLPDGIAVVNRTGRVVYVNQVMINQTGSSKEEILGKRFTKLQALRIRDIPRFLKIFSDAIRGKIPEPFDVYWNDKSGKECCSEVRVSAVRNEGKFVGLMSIARDVTDRKHIEDALKDSQRFQQVILDTIRDAVIFVDTDMKIAQCNKSVERILGYKQEELVGKNYSDIIPSDLLNDPQQKERQIELYEMGYFFNDGFQLKKKDGSVFEASYSVALVFDRAGTAQGMVGTIRDTSETKRFQNMLIESEKNYSQLFSLAPIGIGLARKNGAIIDLNNHLCEMLGIYPDDVANLDVGDFYVSTIDRVDILKELHENGIVRNREIRQKRRDGSIFWVLINIDTIEYDGEQMNLTTIRDITKLKQASMDLQASESNFRTLFENTPNAVALQRIIYNDVGEPVDFEFLRVNRAFLQQAGLTKDLLVGKTVTEVYPGIETSQIDWIQIMGAVAKSGESTRFDAFMEQYNRWYQIDAFSPKQDHFVTILTDIHEMKLSEASLRAAKERAETYLDIAGVMFLALDVDGTIIMVNKMGCEILGCSPEDVIGRNWFDEFLPPEISDEMKDVHRKLIAGESEGVETYINTIKTVTGEDRIIEWRNTQLKAEDNNVYGVISSGMDISNIMEAQKSTQTERDRAMLYLDLMSHDIRNKLQAIMGSAEIMLQVSESDLVQELTKDILDASERCRIIISKIKKTEQLTSTPLEKTSLSAVLVQTVLQFSQIYSSIEIIMNRTGQMCFINADEFLDDMLYTVLENAATHNPREDKRIWVRKYEERGGYTIVISDNGVGLSEDQKDVLFDTERRIAGVGLHQVRHIIEKYKGHIRVSDRLEGRPSAGAEFRIWIPKVNEN